MRSWIVGIVLAAAAAGGCGGSGGGKAEVPKNPVPRQDPGQSAAPAGKGVPGPQAAGAGTKPKGLQ